jgi:hypothetical protein
MLLIKRYILTFFFNAINSLTAFIASIVIARYLMPTEYGNYQFLFSIFVIVLTFINLNTQNAYFTFASQKKQSFLFYRDYFVWECFQLLIVLLVVIVLHFVGLSSIFLNQDLLLIFLAIFAVYGSKNIREFIINTFESRRMTTFYLKANFVIGVVHLILIILFALNNILSIAIVFILSIFEFTIYLLTALLIFWKRRNIFIAYSCKYSFNLNIKRYFDYVKPLFFSSLVTGIYLFLERWLLQKYGGSEEQAYLMIAIQFSNIILILTTSILKIFWKDAAEYFAEHNYKELETIFMRIAKYIFIVASSISIFLIINAKEVIIFVYGKEYLDGVDVFMLISFYAIHQSLGQVYGVLMLASGKTKTYSYISILFGIISMILIFIAVLPVDMFGFQMGAVGVGMVMVSVQLLSVCIMGYIIRKSFGFHSMALFQLKYLSVLGGGVFMPSVFLKTLDVSIFFLTCLQIVLIAIISYVWFVCIGDGSNEKT